MAEIRFFWEEPVPVELIYESWSAAFHVDRDKNEWIRMWDWRFRNNPFSVQPLVSYIMEGGVVACFYGVSPIDLMAPDGTTLKSGLMNMGFTHPDHQGKGYYLDLNNEMHNRLNQLGFQTIFGFANHNSHYVYRKYLDWMDIGLLTTFQLSAGKHKLFLDKHTGYTANAVPVDDNLIKILGKYFVTTCAYHCSRVPEYLSWRVQANPYNKYSAIGVFNGSTMAAVAIYKEYDGHAADIMEIFREDIVATDNAAMLKCICQFLIKAGFKKLNMWSNLHTEEHLELEKLGFIETSVTTHFGVIDFGKHEGISDIHNWHYRFLDSDVY